MSGFPQPSERDLPTSIKRAGLYFATDRANQRRVYLSSVVRGLGGLVDHQYFTRGLCRFQLQRELALHSAESIRSRGIGLGRWWHAWRKLGEWGGVGHAFNNEDPAS